MYSGAGNFGYDSGQILFLAILLDSSLYQVATGRIQRTCREYGFTRQPISADRFHITLKVLGAYSEPLATEISEIAASVRFPAFDIRLDKALSYRNRNPHPFVLTSDAGLDPVRAFYQVLDERLTAGGFASAGKHSFNPHMTLIWDPKMVPVHNLMHPLKWTAQDFALVRSYQGQSRYDIVERWPLDVE